LAVHIRETKAGHAGVEVGWVHLARRVHGRLGRADSLRRLSEGRCVDGRDGGIEAAELHILAGLWCCGCRHVVDLLCILESAGHADVERRRPSLLPAELWLGLELVALVRVLHSGCGARIVHVHVHVVHVVILERIAGETLRKARGVIELGSLLVVVGLAVLLLLQHLGGSTGICVASVGKQVLFGRAAHGLSGDLSVGFFVVLEQLVQRVECDSAADVVLHEVGLHLGKVRRRVERGRLEVVWRSASHDQTVVERQLVVGVARVGGNLLVTDEAANRETTPAHTSHEAAGMVSAVATATVAHRDGTRVERVAHANGAGTQAVGSEFAAATLHVGHEGRWLSVATASVCSLQLAGQVGCLVGRRRTWRGDVYGRCRRGHDVRGEGIMLLR
jgi:hypothetical protein